MLTKVVAALKTGSVKNVVPFGMALPAPPYVVVKPESAISGRRFRVIAHFSRGQILQMEDYIREVCALLSEFQATSRHGAVNRLGRVEQIQDIAAVSDDNTISMEAAFVMPTHTF